MSGNGDVSMPIAAALDFDQWCIGPLQALQGSLFFGEQKKFAPELYPVSAIVWITKPCARAARVCTT